MQYKPVTVCHLSHLNHLSSWHVTCNRMSPITVRHHSHLSLWHITCRYDMSPVAMTCHLSPESCHLNHLSPELPVTLCHLQSPVNVCHQSPCVTGITMCHQLSHAVACHQLSPTFENYWIAAIGITVTNNSGSTVVIMWFNSGNNIISWFFFLKKKSLDSSRLALKICRLCMFVYWSKTGKHLLDIIMHLI